jgi:hypothetical protein
MQIYNLMRQLYTMKIIILKNKKPDNIARLLKKEFKIKLLELIHLSWHKTKLS